MSLTTVDGRYQVIARIAAGGMGQVLRARDSVLEREVAVKVLHASLAGDQSFIDRFRLEARAAANLSHPNIVAVHDWGSQDGTYFMVMEYVRGHSMRDVLAATGRLEPAQAVEALLQMLAALEHAHRHGIVHRDIKPENALVTQDGVVKVADFGLARAYAESRVTMAPGTVTGTVQYLAPEQIRGEPADPRTDLYALGIVAYELLTGDVPFHGETSLAIAYRHLQDPVPAPSRDAPAVPAQLDRIVIRATAKDPNDRPQSAAAMREDLVAIAGALPPAEPLADVVRRLPPQDHPPDDRATTVTIPRLAGPRGARHRAGRRWIPWVALLVALLAGAWAVWTYAIPHYTTVPSVLGQSLDKARDRLESAGFDVVVGDPVASTKYADGTVAQQSAFPGARARTGADIVLRVSTGPPLRTVPSLEGLPVAKARAKLEHADLFVDVRRQFSLHVPKGQVISQSPDASQRIPAGNTVHVVVSAGPQPVKIPDVVGRSGGDAVAILRAAGFQVERIEDYSTTVPLGDVIRQHPANGTAPEGSTVTIVVSKGPRQFPMPDVKGESRGAAEAQLRALGLDVNVSVVPASTGATVVGQSPSPGTIVQAGQSVTIYVA